MAMTALIRLHFIGSYLPKVASDNGRGMVARVAQTAVFAVCGSSFTDKPQNLERRDTLRYICQSKTAHPKSKSSPQERHFSGPLTWTRGESIGAPASPLLAGRQSSGQLPDRAWRGWLGPPAVFPHRNLRASLSVYAGSREPRCSRHNTNP